MATKINTIQKLLVPGSVMNSSWLESNNISRTEQVLYVKSGWLKRITTGIYHLSNFEPTLWGCLSSCHNQTGLIYRVAASTALELQGYSHYISMGKPQAFVATPTKRKLPKWLLEHEWDMEINEFSTNIFDGTLGITEIEVEGHTLQVSSPELAIMECLILSPDKYNLMDVYHLMEMLTTLRSGVVTKLLEQCTSVKVKRLFLYMAEKSGHAWFKRLNLSNVSLGSGPRSFSKGGVKNAKYNIVIPQDLANYE